MIKRLECFKSDTLLLSNDATSSSRYAFISKNYKYISTIHKGGIITVWILEGRQILFQYFSGREIRLAVFSDDECYIIFLSDQLYFLRIDQQIVTKTVHIGSHINLILDHSSLKRVYCSTTYYKLLVINRETLNIQEVQLANYPTCMIHDNQFLYYSQNHGIIQKVCLNTFEKSYKSICKYRLNAISFTDNNTKIIAGGDLAKVFVVLAQSLEVLKVFEIQNKRVDFILAIENRAIVNSHVSGSKILDLNIETDEIKEIDLKRIKINARILGSGVKDEFIYLDFHGNVRNYNLELASGSWVLPSHCEKFSAFWFDQEKKIVFVGGSDGLIRVWNVIDQMIVSVLDEHCLPITSLLLIENYGTLVSASIDADFVLWDIVSFSKIRKFSVHSLRIKNLLSCLNSQFFISVSEDSTICVLDLLKREINKKIEVSGKEIGNFYLPKNSKFIVEILIIMKEFRIWKGFGDY